MSVASSGRRALSGSSGWAEIAAGVSNASRGKLFWQTPDEAHFLPLLARLWRQTPGHRPGRSPHGSRAAGGSYLHSLVSSSSFWRVSHIPLFGRRRDTLWRTSRRRLEAGAAVALATRADPLYSDTQKSWSSPLDDVDLQAQAQIGLWFAVLTTPRWPITQLRPFRVSVITPLMFNMAAALFLGFVISGCQVW